LAFNATAVLLSGCETITSKTITSAMVNAFWISRRCQSILQLLPMMSKHSLT